MSEEELARISGMYIEKDIHKKFKWTFDQFISAYQSGYYQKLVEND